MIYVQTTYVKSSVHHIRYQISYQYQPAPAIHNQVPEHQLQSHIVAAPIYTYLCMYIHACVRTYVISRTVAYTPPSVIRTSYSNGLCSMTFLTYDDLPVQCILTLFTAAIYMNTPRPSSLQVYRSMKLYHTMQEGSVEVERRSRLPYSVLLHRLSADLQ